MVEELFAAQDDRFVDAFRSIESSKYIASFVDKWLKDSRPWAREKIVDYLQCEWSPLNHDVAYKRIFKHFFAASDHEMMGVLMCELDRIVRRKRVKRHHYDRKSRQSWSTESLYAAPNKTNKWQHGRKARDHRLFAHRTRNYLRRAAWRYFRILSHREPDAYVRQISIALMQYVDRDFRTGESIIDNWSLMHACFFHHDAIAFTGAHANLAEGKSLSDLSPKPYQPDAWNTKEAVEALLDLIVKAKSTLVRIWAMDLFLQNHKSSTGQISLSRLVQMMASPDQRVQQFACDAFDSHPDLPKITVQQWLELLNESSVNLLPQLCEAMKKHVAEERLDASQLIQLTCAQQVPVTMMGFDFLKSRDQRRPFSAVDLSRLANCKSAQQSPAITSWALERISQRDEANLPDHAICFFDSLLKPTRIAAIDWISTPDSPGYNRAKLWAMLVETPFDDVKLRMVDLLYRRQESPANEDNRWSPVWIAVILGVNRGGRTKPKAMLQLANEIIRHSDKAKDLLPVLAVAIRSIRAPEMRHGLAAIARIIHHRPELENEISVAIPELETALTEGTSWT